MKNVDFIKGLRELEIMSPEALLTELCDTFAEIGVSCIVTEGDLDIAALLPEEVKKQNHGRKTLSFILENKKDSVTSELHQV